MRLYELIDFEPKKSKQTRWSQDYKTASGTKSKELGQGSFGTAYDIDSPKRLNQVTKVGQGGNLRDAGVDNIAEDGYLMYLKCVYDYEQAGNSNPYFPRIHDLKIRKNEHDGAISYRANIEKLYEYETEKIEGNEDLMLAMYDHMFHRTDDHPDIIHALNMVRYGKHNIIKDPELKEAIIIIDGIIEKGNFSCDLYPQNLMWRITGTMPHLVFTDPIA